MPAVKTSRPRRSGRKAQPLNNDLDNTIEQLYEDDDGQRPNLSKLERRRSRPGFWVTALILLFLGAATGAAWLGFFLFNPTEKFSDEQLLIEITPPTEIIAGVPQTYSVLIRNENNKPLASSVLYLKYPTGFVATESSPTADSAKLERWLLGTIDAGSEKTVTVTGIMTPTEFVTSTWQASLTFRPSNFNSDFQKKAEVTRPAPRTAVHLTLKKENKNKQATLLVNVKNDSTFVFTNLGIIIDSGANFTVSSTNPKATNNSNPWEFILPELKPGATQTLSLPGTSLGELQASVSAQILIGENKINIATTSTAAAALPPVAQTNIQKSNSLSLLFMPDKTTVAPGDGVDFVLTVLNGTSTPTNLASLVVQADTPSVKNKSIFDYNKLGTDGDPEVVGKQLSAERRGATITWLPVKMPLFSNIAPGGEIKIKFHLTAKTLEIIGNEPTEKNSSFQATLTTTDNKTIKSDALKIDWLSPTQPAASSTAPQG